MTVAKTPSAAICTLKGSLLTLAIVTLVSFTYFSLHSLHSYNSDRVRRIEDEQEELLDSGHVVQRHFQWNSPPVKYDAFHMVMYDLWLRRHVIKY